MKTSSPANPADAYIRALLKGYYAGETTPAQETALLRYFTSENNIAPDLEAEADMFKAISVRKNSAATAVVPENLEMRILQSTVLRHRRNKRRAWLSAAAAAILVAVCGSWLMLRQGAADIAAPDTLSVILASETPHKQSDVTIQSDPEKQISQTQSGRYREVTDSATAIAELQRACAKLQRVLAKCEAGLSTAESSMQQTSESMTQAVETVNTTINKVQIQ